MPLVSACLSLSCWTRWAQELRTECWGCLLSASPKCPHWLWARGLMATPPKKTVASGHKEALCSGTRLCCVALASEVHPLSPSTQLCWPSPEEQRLAVPRASAGALQTPDRAGLGVVGDAGCSGRARRAGSAGCAFPSSIACVLLSEAGRKAQAAILHRHF